MALRCWIRASPSRGSFFGWLRPFGAQSEVSASAGAEGSGRKVWVSTCSGGELSLHFGFATSGFGSVNTRHFGHVSLVGLRSRGRVGHMALRRHGSGSGITFGQSVSTSVHPDRNRSFGPWEERNVRVASAARAEQAYNWRLRSVVSTRGASVPRHRLRKPCCTAGFQGVLAICGGSVSALHQRGSARFGGPGVVLLSPSGVGAGRACSVRDQGSSSVASGISASVGTRSGHAVVAHTMASAVVGQLLPW